MQRTLLLPLLTLLIACGTVKKSRRLAVPESVMAPEGPSEAFLASKFHRGIDFIASGNEPSWGLELRVDGRILFTHADGWWLRDTFPDGLPSAFLQTGLLPIHPNSATTIGLKIEERPCFDALSGAKSPFSVFTRTVNGTDSLTFTGCGRWLSDPELAGDWRVRSMGEQVVDTSAWTSVPTVSFEPGKSSIYGFSGCNAFSGRLQVFGRTLRIHPLRSTRKACPPQIPEAELFKALAPGFVNYRIEKGILSITRDGSNILTLDRKTLPSAGF